MPRAPRLLVCTDTWPPQVNGVSVVTALSVAGLRARGWDVAVVAPRYPAPRQETFPSGLTRATAGGRLMAVPSVPLPLYPDIRLAFPDARAVSRLIDDFAPDLVHSATEFVLGRLGQRLAVARGIPTASSYHTDFSRYTEAYGVGFLRPTVSRYISRFHARSRRVYTPSAVAAGDLGQIGVPNVEVWGRGVDTQLFAPVRRSDALRSVYGAPDAFLLLHVGRLAAEKGVERILEAYGIAREQLGEGGIHLVIAGAGPKEDALRKRAPRGVTFLGNLDRQETLPRLYASADAFVFSSLTETLGLVILEAMSAGLPVIAAPAGGVADHLRDGVNGLAVPPADVPALAAAMVHLAVDRPLARRLGLGARATAESLDWERELDRLDESYREIAFPDGSPAGSVLALQATA